MANWGFDVDEVICDFVPTFLSAANSYFGTSVVIDDLKDYYIHHALGISYQRIMDFMATSFNDVQMANLPARLDGLSTVKYAKSRGHRVYIITSRTVTQTNVTIEWLEKYGIQYDGLTLTHHKDKNEAAKKYNVDYLVEDNPDYALAAAEMGIKVFVPVFPWNIHLSHKNVEHIENVSQIMRLL